MTIRKNLATGIFSILLATASTAAFAQIATDPGHPRVNQVDQRLDNQQNRVDAGVANGTITPKQAGRDETRDARIEQRASADEAKNGGHLTKGEQHRLNRSLNKNSAAIKAQKAN